jgi:hypothetical protein
VSSLPRPRLTTRGHRQFGHREIIEMVPAAQQQLELFAAEGLSRAQWHAQIGRTPAIERDDDITTLVIAMLEERAETTLKPPAPSRRAAAKQRQKERA